jgi:hypothetical protein
MARTNVTRRIVHASEVVEDALTKEDLVKPETATPSRVLALTYEQRLERQIELSSLALNKYERKLRAGIDLNIDEERLMISQQDSLRKLETTLQALNAKQHLGDETDLDVALRMIEQGADFEQACAAFGHNPELPVVLREALDGKR